MRPPPVRLYPSARGAPLPREHVRAEGPTPDDHGLGPQWRLREQGGRGPLDEGLGRFGGQREKRQGFHCVWAFTKGTEKRRGSKEGGSMSAECSTLAKGETNLKTEMDGRTWASAGS